MALIYPILYVDLLRSANGHIKIVKLLLKKGADIHAVVGYTEIVRLLLENGASIHSQNDYALRMSAKNGHLEVVKVLLEYGADVNALDLKDVSQRVKKIIEKKLKLI